MQQSTSHILMVRPFRFSFNEETAASNSFQKKNEIADIQEKALQEFDALVALLRENHVQVWVVDDTEEPHTPDSIFPNNWISMHEDSRIGIYPMQAANRRQERRADIINHLAEAFSIYDIADYTLHEKEDKFLEGTGSMVLDRINKRCYACISPRTDKELLEKFCADFNYIPVIFTAVDGSGKPIYHTNVVMCIGTAFMVICMDAIPDENEREAIRSANDKTLIEISLDQLKHFAGNMLEVTNEKGERLLVMSDQAYKSLTGNQVTILQTFVQIISTPLYVIESNGGGSARCMMAEIFLPVKKQ